MRGYEKACKRGTLQTPMRRLFLLVALLALCVPTSFCAAAPNGGDLIKGSGPSVYYFGSDSKRYVFPTEKTYLSWYADFSTVKTISDTELASYMLGGNVTYKPGSYMVKITTDPKVYAVDAHGTLRWVQTETLAQSLYGATWAKQIHDIPDAFFVNYNIGLPIVSLADFVPATVGAAAISINTDRVVFAVPTPTPTPTPAPTPTPTPAPTRIVTTSASKEHPALGETVQLTASASPSGSLVQVEIFFDGFSQRICTFSPCSVDYTIPSSGTKTSYDFQGVATWMDLTRASATTTITPTSGAAGVLLTVPRAEIKKGAQREAIVTVDLTFTAKSIYVYVDGALRSICSSTQVCRYIEEETSNVGTTHSLYAIIQDANGFTRQSNSATISVVENPRPAVSILTGKDLIYVNETVDVTATASSDANAIVSTEIWLDGTLAKSCTGSTCTLIAGPWTSARTLNFVAKATDNTGLSGFATSTRISVQ